MFEYIIIFNSALIAGSLISISKSAMDLLKKLNNINVNINKKENE